MANFTNYTKDQDPNYLGYSKGIDVPSQAHSALATLFSGVSNTLDKGLKGATDALDIQIERDAKAKTDNSDVEGLTLEDAQSLGKLKSKVLTEGSSATDDSEGAGQPEGQDGGGGPGPGSTPIVPMEVTKGLSNLDKLYQRYQSGQLSPTYWLTQQQMVAQQLKARYPGSETEIDRALHRETSSANAVRTQLYSDFQAAATQANSANKAWDRFVIANADLLGPDGMRLARSPEVYNNKTLQTEILANIAGQKQREHAIRTTESELKLKQLQGNVNADDFERGLIQDASNKAAAALGGLFSPLSGLTAQVENAKSAGNFNPDLIRNFNVALDHIEKAFDEDFQQHSNAPRFNGQSYASLIKNPAAIDKIRETSKMQITALRKAINDDNVGLAGYLASQVQRTKNYEAGKVYQASETAKILAGIDTAFGGPGNNVVSTILSMGKTGALADIYEDLKGKLTANKIKGAGSIAEATQKGPDGKDPPPEIPRFELNSIRIILNDPQSTPEMKQKLVTYITNDRTGEFFRQLNKESQLQAFNNMTDKANVKSISEAGDPQTWSKFKQWTQEVHTSLLTNRIGELRSIAQYPDAQLRYNPETNLLVFNPLSKGITGSERQTLEQINTSLKNIGNVYEADKTDPSSTMGPLFQSMGVKTLPKAQEGGGGGDTLGILKPTLAPNLDEQHITGMKSDLQQGLAQLIQDAPGAITINSGNRTPQRQKELYDAAVKQYGPDQRMVAPPGRSMHNHGNAADLQFSTPEVRQWVYANAEKYGLHFPVMGEPWHVETIGARR